MEESRRNALHARRRVLHERLQFIRDQLNDEQADDVYGEDHVALEQALRTLADARMHRAVLMRDAMRATAACCAATTAASLATALAAMPRLSLPMPEPEQHTPQAQPRPPQSTGARVAPAGILSTPGRFRRRAPGRLVIPPESSGDLATPLGVSPALHSAPMMLEGDGHSHGVAALTPGARQPDSARSIAESAMSSVVSVESYTSA